VIAASLFCYLRVRYRFDPLRPIGILHCVGGDQTPEEKPC